MCIRDSIRSLCDEDIVIIFVVVGSKKTTVFGDDDEMRVSERQRHLEQ